MTDFEIGAYKTSALGRAFIVEYPEKIEISAMEEISVGVLMSLQIIKILSIILFPHNLIFGP